MGDLGGQPRARRAQIDEGGGLLDPGVFCEDDRGRVVCIREWNGPSVEAAPPRAPARKLRTVVLPHKTRGVLIVSGIAKTIFAGSMLLLIVLCVIGLIWGAAILIAQQFSIGSIAGLAIVIGGAVVAYLIYTLTIRKSARAEQLTDAIVRCLRRRVCPSCGYPLPNVEPQEDGCTVCPECGAAWNVGHWSAMKDGGETQGDRGRAGPPTA